MVENHCSRVFRGVEEDWGGGEDNRIQFLALVTSLAHFCFSIFNELEIGVSHLMKGFYV
jgi:hypothetical protein